jgi:hypothetical protein
VIRPPQTLVDDLTTILQWTRGSRAVPYPEIDTINVIIGDGVNPLVAGVAAAIRVDFNSRITGIFLQEFDGTSGSVSIKIEKGAGGPTPAWIQITPTTVPGISGGRYFADETLAGWADAFIARNDYLRFSIVSAATIMRVHIALRIRRLEP